MKVYGIKNCDTVKKALKWLDESDLSYDFHDFKKDGLSPEQLELWEQAVGWEALINRRGTTWRKLPDEVRDNIDARAAHEVMLDNPSMIKRPVVEYGNDVLVGFNADEWAKRF